MSKLNDGGPAFPADSFAAQHGPGMSLRDWFAGQLAPPLLAELYAQLRAEHRQVEDAYAVTAGAAYEMADAMLSERVKSLNTSSEKDAG